MLIKLIYNIVSSANMDYTPQYIGVAGTLLGTLLGWLLRHVTDSTGRVRIETEQIHFLKSQNNEFAYLIKLYFYNNSMKPRHIKNLKVQFYKRRKMILESVALDKNDGLNYVGISSKALVKIISLTPFEAFEQIICNKIEENEFKLLSTVDRVKLSYQDEMGKLRKVSLQHKFDLDSVATYKDGIRFT